jgi:hypothetical protein
MIFSHVRHHKRITTSPKKHAKESQNGFLLAVLLMYSLLPIPSS